MTTRRELFPLLAGRPGFGRAALVDAAAGSSLGPELRRVSYQSARTGKTARLLRLSAARIRAAEADWPVMLFLHGDGERGDAQGRARLRAHRTARCSRRWCQQPRPALRDHLAAARRCSAAATCPTSEIARRAQIPAAARELDQSAARRHWRATVRAHAGQDSPDDRLPEWPAGTARRLERDRGRTASAMVDQHRSPTSKAIRSACICTGLSYGGFGAWNLAARHPQKFAALAPIVGYGASRTTPSPSPRPNYRCGCSRAAATRSCRCATSIRCSTSSKRWAIPRCASRSKKTSGHLTWIRVYEGQDLYSWMAVAVALRKREATRVASPSTDERQLRTVRGGRAESCVPGR